MGTGAVAVDGGGEGVDDPVDPPDGPGVLPDELLGAVGCVTGAEGLGDGFDTGLGVGLVTVFAAGLQCDRRPCGCLRVALHVVIFAGCPTAEWGGLCGVAARAVAHTATEARRALTAAPMSDVRDLRICLQSHASR
jgi:hypothetical protein